MGQKFKIFNGILPKWRQVSTVETERNGKRKSKVENCQSRAVKLPNTPNAGDNLHLKRTQSVKYRPKLRIFDRILPKIRQVSTVGGCAKRKTINPSNKTVSQGLLGCPTCQIPLKICTTKGSVDAKYIIQKIRKARCEATR